MEANNEKYYQEADENRALDDNDEIITVKTKPYQGAAFSTVGRYSSISHLSRRAYKNAQDKIHQSERNLIDNNHATLLAKCTQSQVVRCCANQSCKIHFIAKKADVARGWAKFCSKSCKAQKQHWSN
jgi:hypothetical protein